MDKRQITKKLYGHGLKIEEIAALLDLKPTTLAAWKDKDGDWDAARLDRLLTRSVVLARRNAFLISLFDFFEQDLPNLTRTQDPADRLELLRAYVRNFTALVDAARRAEPETDPAEVAAASLRALATLALNQERRDIVTFIQANLDDIATSVRRELEPLAH